MTSAGMPARRAAAISSSGDGASYRQYSVSCGRPFGWGPRSLTCAYALFVHNTDDGTRQLCLGSVHVYKTPTTGRLYGRSGSQSCF
jgi:hypothetical protein